MWYKFQLMREAVSELKEQAEWFKEFGKVEISNDCKTDY